MDFKNTTPNKSNSRFVIAIILIAIGALFLSGSLKVELNASVENSSEITVSNPSNIIYEYKTGISLPVYFFTSSWCGSCELIENKIKAVANNYEKATFMILNIEEYRDLANMYEIFLTPGLIFPKENNSVIYSQIDINDLEKILNINLLQAE